MRTGWIGQIVRQVSGLLGGSRRGSYSARTRAGRPRAGTPRAGTPRAARPRTGTPRRRTTAPAGGLGGLGRVVRRFLR